MAAAVGARRDAQSRLVLGSASTCRVSSCRRPSHAFPASPWMACVAPPLHRRRWHGRPASPLACPARRQRSASSSVAGATLRLGLAYHFSSTVSDSPAWSQAMTVCDPLIVCAPCIVVGMARRV